MNTFSSGVFLSIMKYIGWINQSPYDDFSSNKLRDAKSFFREKESSSHVSNDFIFPNRNIIMFRAVNAWP